MNRGMILNEIIKILTEANIKFTYVNGVFECGTFDVLPVFRTSTFNVAEMINAKNTKLVFEGTAERDLAKLRGYFTPKTSIRGKLVSFEIVENGEVPDFAKEIYSEDEYTYKEKMFDVLAKKDGILLHWTRYVYKNEAEGIIALQRPASNPLYHIHGSTGKELAFLKKELNFKRMYTLTYSKLSHYYALGFKDAGALSYASLKKQYPDFDCDYACAENIPLYWIYYDNISGS